MKSAPIQQSVLRTRTARTSIALLLAAAAAILLVSLTLLIWHPWSDEAGAVGAPGDDAVERPVRVTSVDDARQLIAAAQQAVGWLENLYLAEAESQLVAITRQLPREPIGYRNLAICRYLMVAQGTGDVESLKSSLRQLEQLEGNHALTHWLLAKSQLQFAPTDKAAAIRHFAKAAELQPENPLFPYEIYSVTDPLGTDPLDQQGREALQRAYALVPDNLFVLVDWLSVQAQQHDASIMETIERAEQILAPLRASIQKRHKEDVLARLQLAAEAASAERWNEVLLHVRICGNLIRPHDFAQSDKRALTPHVLEFAALEFTPQFWQQFPQIRPGTASSSPAPWSVAWQTWPEASAAPAVDDCRAMVLVDMDLDDRVEWVLLRGQRVEVYKQSADSGAWSELMSLELPAAMDHLLAADMDHDRVARMMEPVQAATELSNDPAHARMGTRACFEADTDLVAYGEGGILVLKNVLDDASSTRRLEIVPQSADALPMRAVRCGLLADVDHDSNLDIVASHDEGLQILLSQGDMTFTDVSQFSQLPALSNAATGLMAVDWDRDVDLDILLAAPDDRQVGYLENLRHGNFRWRTLPPEYVPLREARRLMAVEADGNVSWDLVAAGQGGLSLALTRTIPASSVQVLSSPVTHPVALDDIVSADLDNDGWQDIVGWTAERISIWRGTAQGTLETVSADLPPLPALPITQCDVCDLDDDGDLDLAVLAGGRVAVLRNEGGNRNHWIAVRAMGQVDNAGKVNHHGIGSLLELKAGPSYQAQVVARPVTHFGLGTSRQVDVIRLLWTNGVPQDVIAAQANQTFCEPMTLKGSCPYIYTWSGERFEFFTDCLWAAPIGLQWAEDVAAPSRAWEYLLIPGNRLAAHEGQYLLQTTEELWEATYFDHVELLAVDHPADVQIYSNEKVGPAEISQFQLHAVREPRYPISARDQRGRDVSAAISRRDGQYLRCWDKTIVPGRVEEHFLELDLGRLDHPQRITLFLTGWIYPTDTSSNISLSRQPKIGAPRGPAIHVQEADGSWKEARAVMGFPGGKTKTIAVDLSGLFVDGIYRLRIVTSAEIYWDEVFFTADEPPAQMRLTPLTLEAADLHYRGFSRALPTPPNAPERYDYADVTTHAKWPPMSGYLTRYGDVHELLCAVDNRLVVMGSGDELTLRFRAPAGDPPPGWTRDFIMHNVGWDKDADMNTIFGQSFGPLPFQSMSGYPDVQGNPSPEDPLHRDYVERFQTRRSSALEFWRRVKAYSRGEQR